MSLLDFHKSMNAELLATRNRVKDLLEPTIHHGEDGRFKEVALRQVLNRHLPDQFHLSTGFVRLSSEATSQLDLVITNNSAPILFREGDFQISTPGTVEAIIEVKTGVNSAELKTALKKLADNVAKIRKEKAAARLRRKEPFNPTKEVWAGLFAFRNQNVTEKQAVDLMRDAADGDPNRIIQAVSIGPDLFARYWSTPPDPHDPDSAARWHAYQLKDLAFPYFIGNTIWRQDDDTEEQRHWFPLLGGKEGHLRDFALFQNGQRTPSARRGRAKAKSN